MCFLLFSSPQKVWIWPGSVFSSERWLDQLQQQTIEWSNSSSCKRRLTKKDLMAVIEGHFFLKPHPHPVNISDSQFRSYEVSYICLFIVMVIVSPLQYSA